MNILALLTSVSIIGNTGEPQTTAGHVPFWFAGMAADHQGRVYTVHTWDEPHQDVMVWDAANGQKLSNTGSLIPEALLNSIAVEPDGSVAYVIGWTEESPGHVFRLYKVQMSPPALIDFTVAGRSIELATGQPSSKFGVRVNNHAVQVGNPNTGQIVSYDKESGAILRTVDGTLPDDATLKCGGYVVNRQSIANGAGARLIGQGWEERCSEFSGCIAYSQTNPNMFISMSRNLYNRSGAWLGCGVSDVTKEPLTTGPIKVVTLGGNDFLYFPYAGVSLAIYRLNGPQMNVVATVNASDFDLQSFGVSPDGALWLSVVYRFSTAEFCSVWKLPLQALDTSGNPVYGWTDATEVISQSALLNIFSQTDPRAIQVMMANYNPGDSLLYVLLYIPGLGADRSIAWMAGNVLAAFTLQGGLAWKASLPQAAIGMAVVPTGGVITGQNFTDAGAVERGTIKRYASDGTLVSTFAPPSQYGDASNPASLASGDFDCYGAINCELAPDGLLDIFAEDDYNGRVFWYRNAK